MSQSKPNWIAKTVHSDFIWKKCLIARLLTVLFKHCTICLNVEVFIPLTLFFYIKVILMKDLTSPHYIVSFTKTVITVTVSHIHFLPILKKKKKKNFRLKSFFKDKIRSPYLLEWLKISMNSDSTLTNSLFNILKSSIKSFLTL